MTRKQTQAALWLMHFGAGMPYTEIAKVTGIRAGRVSDLVRELERRLYLTHRVGWYCVAPLGHSVCCVGKSKGIHVTGAVWGPQSKRGTMEPTRHPAGDSRWYGDGHPSAPSDSLTGWTGTKQVTDE